MTDTSVTLIIGASHAGVQAAVSLRQGGYDGRVVLIGDEADTPYHRPPLSKDYLSGTKSLNDILLRPEASYADANIELMLSTRITTIDPTAKIITTQDGTPIAYDNLILATGVNLHLWRTGIAFFSSIFLDQFSFALRCNRHRGTPICMGKRRLGRDVVQHRPRMCLRTQAM